MTKRSADGLGTQLRRLLELLDGDLEAIYREDHPFYSPRFTPVMKALASGESLTIKEIAERSSVSHSAASQTISKLVKLGLVRLVAGDDKRSRLVSLTRDGEGLLPWLNARWAATQQAANSLEEDLGHSLASLLGEAISALEDRSFADRIREAEHGNRGESD